MYLTPVPSGLTRYVLVIFMEKDTEQEANLQDCSKTFKKVKFLKVDGANLNFYFNFKSIF